jgi:hypothetical protein
VFGFLGRVAFFYFNVLKPQLQKRQLSTPAIHSSVFWFYGYYYKQTHERQRVIAFFTISKDNIFVLDFAFTGYWGDHDSVFIRGYLFVFSAIIVIKDKR